MCCDSVGVALYNIHSISRDLAMHYVDSSLPDWVITSVNMICEPVSYTHLTLPTNREV